LSATLKFTPSRSTKTSFPQFFFFESRPRPRFTPHLFFLFITLPLLRFILRWSYSTWAQVSLGHCNLHKGAGTILFLFFSSRLCLLYDIAATPLSLSSVSLSSVLLSPSPHTCTLPIVSSLRHLPSLSCCLSVSIHACIFPILSRVVVLLYMGLTLSHHLCQSSFIRFCYVNM